jgi:glycosyltransferase involved in cell wall biosynthesis
VIIHTISTLNRSHGGPTSYLESLAQEVPELGHQFLTELGGDAVANHALWQNRKFWTPELGRYLSTLAGLEQWLESPDRKLADFPILHDHGLWRPINWAAYQLGRKKGMPRVVTVHGMLEAWALQEKSRAKALLALLWQRQSLEKADCVHVTSRKEAENLRRFAPRATCAIIPCGVTAPPLDGGSRQEDSKLKIVYLGRLHRVKNIEALLEGVAAIEQDTFELHLAGFGEQEYVDQIRSFASRYRLSSRVFIHDPKLGREKWEFLRSADLFVLPSLSENFGLVVVEAMLCGVPVITTTGTPWGGLPGIQAGWWVEPTVGALKQALTEALLVPRDVLQAMGQRGRVYVQERFDWKIVAPRMQELYQWVSHSLHQPEFVFRPGEALRGDEFGYGS